MIELFTIVTQLVPSTQTQRGTVQQTPDPVRRFADGQLAIDSYPPGEYIVRAVVLAKDVEVATRQRMFVR